MVALPFSNWRLALRLLSLRVIYRVPGEHEDCRPWGIEPAVDRAFQRHRRLDAVPAAPAFDLVLAILVLEHVANPLQLLRQFAGACRVGGHLLISVPRFDT